MLKLELVNAENCENLNDVRKQIDIIDDELLQLIGKRLTYVKRAGELKVGKTTSVQDQERENYILTKASQRALELGFPEEIARAILKEILSQAVQYEKQYHC